ncbi:MAG: chitobiase/beta-hexosaminidase C-terminal domain-containing protein [Bifidobacteriaceae bacterium]|jgi:hypothetical protein|nr:chitobiase/beta-hexosaminidase C-terminal domain-containing protein [Bifidobacteriaceae bacterium]
MPANSHPRRRPSRARLAAVTAAALAGAGIGLATAPSFAMQQAPPAAPVTQTVTAAIAAGDQDAMANSQYVDLTSSGIYLHGAYSSSRTYQNYLRFTGLSLPADAVVTSASISFTLRDSASAASSFAVAAETSAAAAFTSSVSSFTSRQFSDATVEWQAQAAASGTVVNSADLSCLVQAAHTADPARSAYVFKFTGLTPSAKYIARSYNGSASAAPKLTLTYTSQTGRIETPVAASSDDAEEYGTGQSIDLESNMSIGGYYSNSLTAGNKQVSAFRFADVQLPALAEIDDAYIEFTVQATGSSGRSSDIAVKAELGDPATYTSASRAISSRPYGNQVVAYNQPSFTQTGAKARTANLARLIDETRILGWQPGQALAFALEGTNNIGAVYPGGNTANRARLVILYHMGAGPNLDGITNQVACAVTPPGGLYAEGQLVSVDCDAPGQVTYTLDGTNPGPGAGLAYSGPIAIGEGRTQLKVYSTGGLNDVGVLTHNYIVGPAPGTTTAEAAITAGDDDALANATQVDLSSSSLSLHSQYSSSRNYDTYLRFTGLDLPADAVIAGAELVFTASASAPADGRIEVVGETSSRGAFASAPGAFAGRAWTDPVTLTAPKLSSGQAYTASGLGAILAQQFAANADRADWVFKIHGLTPAQALSARSYNGSASAAPKLRVSYYSNYADATIAVADNYDDAEELGANGSMERSGSIQLGGYRSSTTSASTRDVAAFRFAAVALPADATLVDAYIEFTTQADGPSGRTSNLTIQSELGDAGSYPTTAGAITSRKYSLGQVGWQVEAFRQSRATVRTPNLKDLVDEARLGGWTSGQALAFKLDGDGFIGSVYSGPGADAARLRLEYRFDGAGAWENVVSDPTLIEGVYINELSTSGTAANEDDWAELYNATDKFAYLGEKIRLWRDGIKKGDTFDFGGLLLPPKSYVILYADEDTDKGLDHLNFDFKKSGEVNLTDMSSGSPRVIDAFAYSEQVYLETHARQPDGGEIFFMAADSYGYSNNAQPQKYPISFSHDRGRYETGFALEITSLPGAQIRYTVDGSTPSATAGTLYTGPVNVSQSMAVRAVAYDAAGTSTPQTRTYVLLDNLKNEVAASSGRWTRANKATIDDAAYAAALNALPIVSITSDVAELSHSSSADYVQSYFEFMPEPGSGEADYAQPIGVKRFGQVSATRFNSGIAVRFKKDYGAGKAKYEFFKPFEGEPYELVGEYKKLELAEGQDGPQDDAISTHGFLRYNDMATRLLANQMGSFDSHARYVHYFYNGQYAGLKTMREDFGAHTFEPYFDIDSDEFTKVSYQDAYFTSGRVEEGDGDVAVMRAVHAAANSGNYATFEAYVDVKSLIQTMILFRYIDTENEWNAIVQNSVAEGGMKMMFNVNDSDGAFYNIGRTTSATYAGAVLGGGGNYRYKWANSTSQAGPYNMFRTWTRYDTSSQTDGDLEFKTLVKDEVLKQIGPASGDFRGADGAPLSVGNVQAMLLAQQTALEAPYRLDAAYMGISNAWTKWREYNPGVIALVPERTKYNLEQWSKIGLTHTLPEVEAVSDGSGFALAVPASDTAIYYTLDGSDPMGQSGAIPGQSGANPAAQAYTPGASVPAGAGLRAYTPGNWGPLTQAA